MSDIEISDAAVAKISDILAEENNPRVMLRTFVQGGGCAGFQYGFTLDEEHNEDDFVFKRNGMTLVVDAMSMQYLQGATIDYIEDFMSSNFTIKNPNASTQCGCGSSFGI